MKKVPKFVGLTMSLKELLDYSEDMEFYLSDEPYVQYLPSDKVTIKVKGKVVDIKDVSISLEGSDND